MKLYIVGKITEYPAWSFQGVFWSEKRAKKVCKTNQYFVGPCRLNQETDLEDVIWPDAYYPKG